ncbi:MAG: FHA domain-containing protein [Planctomycetes bacterium]|nr:FHA domain-containing protein [Planctomycetota bacterium]
MPTYELEVRDEDGVRRVPLPDTREVVRLGRSTQNDCIVKARGVSRNHCLLLRAESGWKLVDLKSSNASFVKGEPVREASLLPGDPIRIGMAKLWFLEAGAPCPAPPPKSAAKSGATKPRSAQIRKGSRPPAPGSLPAVPRDEDAARKQGRS